jgi:hypothetical protein
MATEAGGAAQARPLAIDCRRVPKHPCPIAHADALEIWPHMIHAWPA